MPSEWQHHADGVKTGVTTYHRLDGSIKSVRLQLDTFKVRSWTEDEEVIEAAGKKLKHLHYDEETDAYEEYGDGAHATLRFSVDGSKAKLKSIEPEDGDRIEPRHVRLLAAAERVITNVDGVDSYETPFDTLVREYTQADEAGIHIDALDA